jgi:hypothetical protein
MIIVQDLIRSRRPWSRHRSKLLTFDNSLPVPKLLWFEPSTRSIVAAPVKLVVTLSLIQTREPPMRKLAITLSAAAFLLGLAAFSADAQTQTGASSFHALMRNATPIVKDAACPGEAKDRCPRGKYWFCKAPNVCSCKGGC